MFLEVAVDKTGKITSKGFKPLIFINLIEMSSKSLSYTRTNKNEDYQNIEEMNGIILINYTLIEFFSCLD